MQEIEYQKLLENNYTEKQIENLALGYSVVCHYYKHGEFFSFSSVFWIYTNITEKQCVHVYDLVFAIVQIKTTSHIMIV